MNERDPEVLCQKCGRCCYHKVYIEGVVHFTHKPCVFLNTQTKLCSVYKYRDCVPWCVRPIEHLKDTPLLPEDCPLAKAYAPPGYVGPKEAL